jgi:hypothetical protein
MTRRQSVLLDRLVTFCERCDSPDLPLRIDRVLGFGSFFRGKERPADVDLLATIGSQHPLFPTFRDLVGQEITKDEASLTPAERMELTAACHADPDVRRARPLFVSWLGGLSNHKLFGQGLPMWKSPLLYTQHLLRASLPGVKVSLIAPDKEHHVQVVHEVWSPERADVRARVEQLWARDQRDDLLKEGVWFERQARALLLEAAILDRVAERLVKCRTRVVATTYPEAWDRFEGWLRTTDLGFPPGLAIDAVKEGLAFWRVDLVDPPGYCPTDFAALATAELCRAVEDKRSELRGLDRRVSTLRHITKYLGYWAFLVKKGAKVGVRDFLNANVPATKSRAKVVSGEMDRLGL